MKFDLKKWDVTKKNWRSKTESLLFAVFNLKKPSKEMRQLGIFVKLLDTIF